MTLYFTYKWWGWQEKGEVICQKLHRKWLKDLGFENKPNDSRILIFNQFLPARGRRRENLRDTEVRMYCMHMLFKCCYSWIITHSCFSIKRFTRTSKQNGINLWLKNYDHLYANESWPYVSERLKKITENHKFWVFPLFYTLPGQV
jgi:hypothetical protein